MTAHADLCDTTIGWRFVNRLMKGKCGLDAMPETAENMPTEYRIEREAQGCMALASQMKASAARRGLATTARRGLATTAVNQPPHSSRPYALCTMCIGVGQGIVLIRERV